MLWYRNKNLKYHLHAFHRMFTAVLNTPVPKGPLIRYIRNTLAAPLSGRPAGKAAWPHYRRLTVAVRVCEKFYARLVQVALFNIIARVIA